MNELETKLLKALEDMVDTYCNYASSDELLPSDNGEGNIDLDSNKNPAGTQAIKLLAELGRVTITDKERNNRIGANWNKKEN